MILYRVVNGIKQFVVVRCLVQFGHMASAIIHESYDYYLIWPSMSDGTKVLIAENQTILL